MKKKLRVTAFLKAGESIALGTDMFSCVALPEDLFIKRTGKYVHAPERQFYMQLFGLEDYGSNGCYTFDTMVEWTFRHSPESMRQLRLMALALAHTLAREHNDWVADRLHDWKSARKNKNLPPIADPIRQSAGYEWVDLAHNQPSCCILPPAYGENWTRSIRMHGVDVIICQVTTVYGNRWSIVVGTQLARSGEYWLYFCEAAKEAEKRAKAIHEARMKQATVSLFRWEDLETKTVNIAAEPRANGGGFVEWTGLMHGQPVRVWMDPRDSTWWNVKVSPSAVVVVDAKAIGWGGAMAQAEQFARKQHWNEKIKDSLSRPLPVAPEAFNMFGGGTTASKLLAKIADLREMLQRRGQLMERYRVERDELKNQLDSSRLQLEAACKEREQAREALDQSRQSLGLMTDSRDRWKEACKQRTLECQKMTEELEALKRDLRECKETNVVFNEGRNKVEAILKQQRDQALLQRDWLRANWAPKQPEGRCYITGIDRALPPTRDTFWHRGKFVVVKSAKFIAGRWYWSVWESELGGMGHGAINNGNAASLEKGREAARQYIEVYCA